MLDSVSKFIDAKLCNKQAIVFLLAYSVPLSFVLIYFVASYARYPNINLPIGWDTPWYINAINLAKNGEFLKLFQIGSYANFLYPLLVSLLPLNAFQLETYVPIFLTAILPLIVFLFVKRASSYNANLAMAISFVWYPIYRLVGLHSNLFGLILSVIATAIFLDKFSFSTKKAVLSLAVIMVSSFVHFEVTLFFTLLLLITFFTSKTEDRSKKFISLIIGILPSLILYSYAKIYRLQTEGGLATGSGTIPSILVSYSLGFYSIPLAIFGLCYIFSKKEKTQYDVFISSWAMLTFLLYFLNFFFPVKNFAERALILFPSIFLIVPLIKGLFTRFKKIDYKQLYVTLSVLLISTLTATALLTASFAYDYYPKIFLDKDIYDELCFLEDYSTSNNTPLIIIYNLDNPGRVEFYANWVSAIVQESVSYYGNLIDLLNLNPGYDNAISKRLYTQGSFGDKNFSSLLEYEIIFVNQFYNGDNSSVHLHSENLCENVWSLNLAELAKQEEISFSISSLWDNTGTGEWYYNGELDAVSIYSNSTENPYIMSHLDLPQEGYYNLSISYWDANVGTGLHIFVNSELKAVINYNSTADFVQYNIKDVFLKNSTNTIKFEVFVESLGKPFARLQSITISPNPFSPSD